MKNTISTLIKMLTSMKEAYGDCEIFIAPGPGEGGMDNDIRASFVSLPNQKGKVVLMNSEIQKTLIAKGNN